MEERAADSIVQPQSRLLCLPKELRTWILELSIETPVTRPGSENRACRKTQSASERADPPSSRPIADDRSEPPRTAPRRLPALTAACKLLYIEGTEIWYRNTELTFTSAEALLYYFRQRPLALRLVQRIRLLCGPAKHGLAAIKSHNKAAIRLLTHGAQRLVELRLVFKPYWGIHFDRQLLGTYWYFHLCRLHPLIRLSLIVSPSCWQGPVGIEFATEEARSKLQRKVQSTEDCFREILGHNAAIMGGKSKDAEWRVVRSLRRAKTAVEAEGLAVQNLMSVVEPQRA